MNVWLAVAAAGTVTAVAALIRWREPVVGFAGRTVAYLREVSAEVRKVSWPTLDDLRKSTISIILFVVALGFLIGIIDWVWSLVLVSWLGRAFT